MSQHQKKTGMMLLIYAIDFHLLNHLLSTVNLSLQKKYKNLTYTLNGDNILDTQIFKVSSMGSELFTQIMRWDFRQPQIKFSILYNFGNQNLKMKKIKSAEEAKRIKV